MMAVYRSCTAWKEPCPWD